MGPKKGTGQLDRLIRKGFLSLDLNGSLSGPIGKTDKNGLSPVTMEELNLQNLDKLTVRDLSRLLQHILTVERLELPPIQLTATIVRAIDSLGVKNLSLRGLRGVCTDIKTIAPSVVSLHAWGPGIKKYQSQLKKIFPSATQED